MADEERQRIAREGEAPSLAVVGELDLRGAEDAAKQGPGAGDVDAVEVFPETIEASDHGLAGPLRVQAPVGASGGIRFLLPLIAINDDYAFAEEG